MSGNTRSQNDPRRLGPLNPHAEEAEVIIHNPPADPMHMSPDEADISGIRMLDAADQARKKRPPS